MRTLQNSKALAGNISMLYHWLWVTVGLGDHIYKSTTYSKKFLQGVLKVLTISDTGGRGMFIFQIYIAKLKSKTCFLMMVGLPL